MICLQQMKPVLFYCYDAYCGWCYGFRPVMNTIAEEYTDIFSFEVLSGGMMPTEHAQPVKAIAGFVATEYKRVEEITGSKFGEDYLWHIFNPDQSDWVPHSEKAAMALCIFKEDFPTRQIEFASDLQYALHYEGRDLTDDEAYRHLIEKYELDADDFYGKLHSEEFREEAHYEFSLCKQLKVTGFPAILVQVEEAKFFMVASGYTGLADLRARLNDVINQSGIVYET